MVGASLQSKELLGWLQGCDVACLGGQLTAALNGSSCKQVEGSFDLAINIRG